MWPSVPPWTGPGGGRCASTCCPEASGDSEVPAAFRSRSLRGRADDGGIDPAAPCLGPDGCLLRSCWHQPRSEDARSCRMGCPQGERGGRPALEGLHLPRLPSPFSFSPSLHLFLPFPPFFPLGSQGPYSGSRDLLLRSRAQTPQNILPQKSWDGEEEGMHGVTAPNPMAAPTPSCPPHGPSLPLAS